MPMFWFSITSVIADLLPVIRDRKARGKPRVRTLRRTGDLPPTIPCRAFYHQSNNLLLIKRLAHYCDALQFSSPELKRKYGYLNPKCCVFPNQILAAPPERKRKSRGKVIVGWGGSIVICMILQRFRIALSIG